MKNILVTGCNGQLGNEMQLLAAGHPEFNYFFTDVKELDITDEKSVKSFVGMHEIDCIVNCAAYTAVDKAESDEAFCDLLNHTAPSYLAKAVHERGGCMIQVSTDYVFDGTAPNWQAKKPSCGTAPNRSSSARHGSTPLSATTSSRPCCG